MNNLTLFVYILFLISISITGTAQNTIIQNKYTANTATIVHKYTVLFYTSHDEDDTDGFKMLD